jgi:ribonuclease P protein component
MKKAIIRQTFKKSERLKSRKIIKALFSRGKSFLVHPFKVNWLMADETSHERARVIISVSSRNFKNASDRNHLKRLCREAYRKNKSLLNSFLKDNSIGCDFAIIYVGKSKAEYSVVEEKIIKLINRLISELEIVLHQNNSSS